MSIACCSIYGASFRGEVCYTHRRAALSGCRAVEVPSPYLFAPSGNLIVPLKKTFAAPHKLPFIRRGFIVFSGELFALASRLLMSRAKFTNGLVRPLATAENPLSFPRVFLCMGCRAFVIIAKLSARNPISLVTGPVLPARTQTLRGWCSVFHIDRLTPRHGLAERSVQPKISVVMRLTLLGTIPRAKNESFKAMPDPTPPDTHMPKPRGYFNQPQLDDLETAENAGVPPEISAAFLAALEK